MLQAGMYGSALTGGVAAAVAAAYSPSNFYSGATRQYWFLCEDSAKVLNSGSTPAGTGVAVQTVNDEGGGGLQLVQATGANQGVVDTGIGTNSKQALKTAAGTQTYALTGTGNTGILKGVSKVSYGCTIKLLGTASNGRFHRQVDSTFTDNIFNAFLATAQPSMDLATTSTGQQTIHSSQTLTIGNIYFLLYEWDSLAQSGNIYVNGTGGLSSPVWPTSGTIENLNANTAPDILSLANVDLLESFMFTGALCSNIAGLTAAIKSRVGF